MDTRVIDIKKESLLTKAPNYKYIGRPSILGNPFIIGRGGTREEVIELHYRYAQKRMRSDPKSKKEVLDCKDKILGCFCSPLPCHGDNYIKILEELKSVRED